jgi:ABC-type multidrug transport system permease subunit
LTTNPEQSILPGIIEETLEILVDGTFYVHRILGEELQMIAAGPAGGATTLPDADVVQISTAVNQVVQRLETYLFPPVIDLQTSVDEAEESEDQLSIAVLFLPGILMMSLLFIAQGLGEDVWKEREQGTLRRMVSTPSGIVKFLVGKLIASSVVVLSIALVILVIGMAYLSVPFANLPLALVWTLFSGALFVNILMLIQMHASSRRAGSILTSSLIFPLLMLGGSFFPSETMPGWLAAIGRFTPNGWALEQLKGILLSRAEIGSVVTGLLIIIAVGLVFFILNARRMERVFAKA